MLDDDFAALDEIERKWTEIAKPAMEEYGEVVEGTLECMPDLLAELRRLDEENDRLRAEKGRLRKGSAGLVSGIDFTGVD